MKRIMTNIVNIPGVIVTDSTETETTLIISVSMDNKTAVCPRCGDSSYHLHQNKKHFIKDLPIGNRSVVLQVNRRRFKCFTCDKPFSEHLHFVEFRQTFTNRYAEKVVSQVIHSDVSNVAKINDLTEEEVWSMVKSVAKNIQPIEVKNLKKLGIDEISLVKGQKNFLVVLVDLESHKLIGLVLGRTQAEIEKVMKSWGADILEQIEEVSIDMSGNYKSLILRICPNAEVTVDRFHVAKIVHEELNQARIDEKKRVSSPKNKEESDLLESLKKSKYVLLKAEKDLSETERDKLKAIKKHSPLIKKMHKLKEEFHEVFEESKDVGSGTIKLINWVKKASAYYKNSVATIKRWLGEIVGYFYNRTTNGIVEGINNKLKLLKRRGFGYRNFDNFKILSLLSWHFPDNFAH